MREGEGEGREGAGEGERYRVIKDRIESINNSSHIFLSSLLMGY
jgi:hypothetical protein